MGIKSSLIQNQMPLVLTASDTDQFANITEPISEAVNFARASQGSAQILVTDSFDDLNPETEPTMKKYFRLIIDCLQAEGEELTIKFSRQDEKLFMVTITSKKS